MATLAIAAAGAGIGGIAFGTSAAFMGISAVQWGWMVGSVVGSLFFGPEGTDTKGPRLTDSTFTGEVEGADMAILWGGNRLTAKPIWIKNPPEEIADKQKTGGKGGSSSSHTTYTYLQDLAVCFGEFICENPPRRIWMNQELVYDASGSNTNLNIGISFSWYPGNTDEIDSLIEQDVGLYNCPSFKGRCVMVIDKLNLTERFGNRIPVIEAELQTTGTASSDLDTWNMGDSGLANQFNNMTPAIRHPTDDTFISGASVNSTYYTSFLFYTDMSAQYTAPLWSGASRDVVSIVWWSNPLTYTNLIPEHFIYAARHTTNAVTTLYKIEYPSGKLVQTGSFSGPYEGCALADESLLHYLGSSRTTGVNIYFINKNSLTPESTHSVDTLTGDTGWLGATVVLRATLLDYLVPTWGSVCRRTSLVADEYLVITYDLISTAVIIKHTGPGTQLVVGTSVSAVDILIGDVNAPGVFIEDTNEIWLTYQNNDSIKTELDVGILAIDADDGSLNYSFDFVLDGPLTTGTSWPTGSGKPELSFEKTQRRIWFYMSNNDVGSIHVDTRNIQWYPGLSPGQAPIMSYPNRNSVWGRSIDTFDYVIKERKLSLIGVGNIAISEIVSDICEICDIPSSEYDVSTLTSKYVGSFVHGSRHSGRSDIEILLGIALGDGVHSDNKLKFPLRGGAVTKTIPEDDLGAQELHGDVKPAEIVDITIPMDIEIPKVYEIQYQSSDNVYSKSIAQSYLATGENISKHTSQLPVALTDQQAFDLADQYHQQMLNVKTFKFSLPIKYGYLEPTDILEIPKGGVNYRVRLTAITKGSNWILSCEGILDYSESYVATAVAPGVDAFIGTLALNIQPNILILDGPLLRDIDNDHPGPYLTSFTYASSYTNASWWYSFDDSSFSSLFAQTSQPIVGIVNNAHNNSIWEEWDDLTSLVVTMVNDGTLSSSTKSAILADPTINAFAYGRPGRWEYINAETCTLTASTPNKVYTLSNLLRGRRGTNNFTTLHGAKDYLIELSFTGIQRQTLQNSQIGNDIYYRLPIFGEAVSDQNSSVLNIDGQQLMPYSPIQLEATAPAPALWVANTAYSLTDVVVGSTNDKRRYICTTAGTSHATTEPTWDTDIGDTTADNTVTWTTYHLYDSDITWTRRTRKGGSLGGDNTLTDGVGGPLNEDSELYDLDYIRISDGVALGTDIDVTTNSHTYLGADQETDGLSAYGHFYIDIYQKSAVVGRGFKSRYYFYRGWGKAITTAIDYGAKLIMPLDDSGGSSAREVISDTTPGTYTSASEGIAVTPDNIKSLEADGSGYMKTGVSIRNAVTGKKGATYIVFVTGSGGTANDRILQVTQGGATNRFDLFWNSTTTFRMTWAPKANVGGLSQTFGDTETANSGACMIACTCDLDGTFTLKSYINGKLEDTDVYGTGHGSWASTFQDQTRNASYNDTVNGTMAASPANINSNGDVGFVLAFDKVLTAAEILDLYNKSVYAYANLIDSHDAIYHLPLTEATTTIYTPRVGTETFTIQSVIAQYRSQNLSSGFGAYVNATSDKFYRALPDKWKLSEMTIEIWITVHTAPTGSNYLVSLEPKDWNGASAKKGVHLICHNTNGLQALIGTGNASFIDVNEGIVNMTANNTYQCVVSIHPTNGVKLYLNGSEIANNSGGAAAIDWVDGTGSSGPGTAAAYLSTYATNDSSIANANGTGTLGYYNDFVIYDNELSATDILNLYRRGTGVIV